MFVFLCFPVVGEHARVIGLFLIVRYQDSGGSISTEILSRFEAETSDVGQRGDGFTPVKGSMGLGYVRHHSEIVPLY